jgi:hypothetical protein
MRLTCATFALLSLASAAFGQQRADTHFHYAIESPAYAPDTGPRVAIDAGHYNFHTAKGRYAPFANLISADGFRVSQFWDKFTPATLESTDLLVISNALNPSNDKNWTLPTTSAFSSDEIEAVENWVDRGGSLLLIADHMPFSGAASDLAKAFGFGFVNGHVFDVATGSGGFSFGETNRLDLGEAENTRLPPTASVKTFSGQAFTIPESAHSILTLNGKYAALMPTTAWKFDENTPAVDVSDYSQGAIMNFGRGKVAVFGEAGAFTAQIRNNGNPMGMNAPGAEDNAAFILKIMRWLAEDP